MKSKPELVIRNKGYAQALKEIGEILQKRKEEQAEENYSREKIEEILEKPKDEEVTTTSSGVTQAPINPGYTYS